MEPAHRRQPELWRTVELQAEVWGRSQHRLEVAGAETHGNSQLTEIQLPSYSQLLSSGNAPQGRQLLVGTSNRSVWGPQLHFALTGHGGNGAQRPPPAPKPCGTYHTQLEEGGIPCEEESLVLIDAQGVPHTVSRQELEQAGQAQLESEPQASSHLSPPPRRLYFCPICLRTFLYQSDLERHSITHSESKPHVCRACGKAFKRASHLQRHRHIHTGQRPFSCHVCHKGFRESGELLRHQRVHTGEKPYQCQLCRLRFTERNTLRRHAKRKHARETFYQRSAAEGGAGGWDDGNWAANNTGLGSWGAWGGGEGSDWGEVPEKMADGDGGETPVTAPESEGTRSEERAGTQLP